MSTVIDALVVTLGLDASAYKRGQREATESQAKFADSTERNAKRAAAQTQVMATGFRSVRRELLGLLAVSVGASSFGAFISGTVGAQAQLGRLATNLNVSARELDAWGRVVGTVGGDAETFQQSMQNIASGVQAFALGEDSPVVAAFRGIGVAVADEENQMRSFLDLLPEVAAALQQFSPQEQLRFASMAGIDEATLNVLRQGPEHVRGQFQRAFQASGVTDESVQRAQETQRIFGEFTDEIRGVAQVVFDNASPAIQDLTGKLSDLGQEWRNSEDDITRFFEGIIAFGESVSGIMERLHESTGGFFDRNLFELWGDTRRDVFEPLVSPFVESFGEVLGREDGRQRPAGPSGQQSMSDYIMSFLMGQTWTREQAAGIVANLRAESNFDPRAVGDGGQAYGIAQWHPPRQRDFHAWAGKPIQESTLEEQLAFLSYEMTLGKEGAAGRALRNTRSAREAGEVVSRRYERPADEEGEALRRGEMAQRVIGATQSAMPLGATANRDVSGSTTINNNQSEVSIGEITVQTQATDASGVALSIGDALRQNALINATSTGMN